MSNFGISEAISIQPGYYMAKLPATNKGHGFTHEERAQNGLRGLYPGGKPFTLEQKVEVRILLSYIKIHYSYCL